MPNDKPLKAYKLWCNDDDHGQRVVFAVRGRECCGRRGDDFCGCDFIDLHATRAPEFDKYPPGPVTTRQYMENGWHWECSGCSKTTYLDEAEDVTTIDEHVFCSHECLRRCVERDAKRYGDNLSGLHPSMREFVINSRNALLDIEIAHA